MEQSFSHIGYQATGTTRVSGHHQVFEMGFFLVVRISRNGEWHHGKDAKHNA